MAITQNPLIGRTSGRFSGAIFSSSYNKNIIRSKPVVVRDAKTAAQETQRSKFKIAQDWVIIFLSIIRAGFASQAVNMSAYAYALGWYMKNALHYVTDHWEINYSLAKFTFGDLLLNINPVINYIHYGSHLTVSWTDNSGTGNAQGDDIVTFIIYDTTQNKFALFTASRDSEEYDDDNYNLVREIGDDLEVYYFITSSTSNNISNTVYLGNFTATDV